jgi:glycosyltransferase involved in cell wall biosynthesis
LGFNNQQLVFTPYCVDNKRFSNIALTVSKSSARKKLQLPTDKKIILFSGKYIDKKNPMHLLQAVQLLQRLDIFTVFVGDGELRTIMEKFIANHRLEQQVSFTGFINQSLIPYYYAGADVFVMCSGIGETWGLSVNEAMNFGLPIVISDTCGSAYDLVKDNGYVFSTGDITALADGIRKVLDASENVYLNMQQKSKAIIEGYSYEIVIERLKQIA